MSGQRIVVALGGNALLQRGQPLDAEHHRANVARAAKAIATVAADNDLVVTHGNGPQVGLLALQAAAYTEVSPYPLDVLGAESEGMIGYLLDQRLSAELGERPVATLLTQVVVSDEDPAFQMPTKPIGPVYSAAEAERLAAERGWTVAPDGDGLRRVVPSPAPLRVVELPAIRLLLDAGVVVICAGGGGIPVLLGDAALRGVEAVVDKDATAALLARELAADVLLILTDVDAVRTGWGTPNGRAIRRASPNALRQFSFPAGSMGPKVDAACRFVTATGGRAAIGRLDAVAELLAGTTGTQVTMGAALELGPLDGEATQGRRSPSQRSTDSHATTPAPSRSKAGGRDHG